MIACRSRERAGIGPRHLRHRSMLRALITISGGRGERWGWMLDRIGQRQVELAGQAGHLRKQLVDIELELADLIAAERVVGRILAEPGAGSSGFHVADELVFQSVPGSVRGSPNRGITLAVKPVTAVMRSSAIVTTSSP